MKPLRVLQVHSEYAHRGGEEVAVEMDAAILRAHGAEVWTVVRRADRSNALEMAGEALGLPLQLGASLHPVDQLKAAIDCHEPDIVHLHHWQRWGPRALEMLGKSGVPLVATAHNYRHWCPKGLAHRDGMPCNLCIGKRFPWPAIKHSCWHGKLGSTVAALGAWQMDWSVIDHWIAVSSFVREVLIEAEIATDERITVRHGSVPDAGPPGDGKESDDVFALAVCSWARREKGLELLLPAWEIRERPGKLVIVGRDVPTHCVEDVFFLPAMPRDELMTLMGRAAFLIVPSIWFDPCPTVVIEALSRGTPVLATRMGGLPELVDERCGWTVAPTSETLSIGIDIAFREAASKRAGARAAYLERFTPEASYERLMSAYGKAQAARLVARGVAEPMGAQL